MAKTNTKTNEKKEQKKPFEMTVGDHTYKSSQCIRAINKDGKEVYIPFDASQLCMCLVRDDKKCIVPLKKEGGSWAAQLLLHLGNRITEAGKEKKKSKK